MAADIISPAATLTTNLDTELENARATLRGVEDNIKRVFGKDASELNTFQQRSTRRSLPTGRSFHENSDLDYSGSRGTMFRGRERDNLVRRRDSDTYGREDEPIDKRKRFDNFSMSVSRSAPIVLTSRLLKPKYESDEELGNGNQYDGSGNLRISREPHQRLQSRIVSSTKDKSREEVLAEQRQDHSGRDRNKRMFGALLGTLHRFKQDETKLKEKEDKRAQIEAKLEEQELQEKESVKKEKQQLIRDRKIKLTEIKRLEIKKRRLEELEEWEVKTKHLRNFIRTETKPHIFYLPKQMNPITECRLEESKQIVEEMIVNKRKLVLGELDSYEEQSKRYWDRKLDGQEMVRVQVNPLDENMEDELKVLMKDENHHEELTSSGENKEHKASSLEVTISPIEDNPDAEVDKGIDAVAPENEHNSTDRDERESNASVEDEEQPEDADMN